jgi:hypothetical protein
MYHTVSTASYIIEYTALTVSQECRVRNRPTLTCNSGELSCSVVHSPGQQSLPGAAVLLSHPLVSLRRYALS